MCTGWSEMQLVLGDAGISRSPVTVQRNTASVLKEEVKVTIPVDPDGRDGMLWNPGEGDDIA